MQWGTTDADFDDTLLDYNRSGQFGGEAEIALLCHLCRGLRVQIVQPGVGTEDTIICSRLGEVLVLNVG